MNKTFTHRRYFIGISLLAYAALITFMVFTLIGNKFPINYNLNNILDQSHYSNLTKQKIDFHHTQNLDISVALIANSGDIFNTAYLTTLFNIQKKIYSLPNINRSHFTSLFSPNTRYPKLMDGELVFDQVLKLNDINKSNVPSNLNRRIMSSEIASRIVSESFETSLIKFQVLSHKTFEATQQNSEQTLIQINDILEQHLDQELYSFRIIGEPLKNKEVHQTFIESLGFLFISSLLVFITLFIFFHNRRLVFILLINSMTTMLVFFGSSIILSLDFHPHSLAVPIFIFVIGIFHGIQTIHSILSGRIENQNLTELIVIAYRTTIKTITITLISICVLFALLSIPHIPLLFGIAKLTALGLIISLFSHYVFLPLLIMIVLPWIKNPKTQKASSAEKTNTEKTDSAYSIRFKQQSNRRFKFIIFILIVAIYAFFHTNSNPVTSKSKLSLNTPSYDETLEFFTHHFNYSKDNLTIYAKTFENGCTNVEIMQTIDAFVWQLSRLKLVTNVKSLSKLIKQQNVAWHEGNLKWYSTGNSSQSLADSIPFNLFRSPLLNHDCHIMPIYVYTNHQSPSEAISFFNQVEQLINKFSRKNVSFFIGGGSLVNQVRVYDVAANQFMPIAIGLVLAISFIIFVIYRSILPMAMTVFTVSISTITCYILYTQSFIYFGLSNMIIAFFGIVITATILSGFYQVREDNKSSGNLTYRERLDDNLVINISLIVGITFLSFSRVNYQADMGLILGVVFLMNVLTTQFLLPATNKFMLFR